LTDSSGTTTNNDARGRVISRESTSGNTTTIYDAGGRNVGRFTTSR
jgi:YD repeat-containing protein